MTLNSTFRILGLTMLLIPLFTACSKEDWANTMPANMEGGGGPPQPPLGDTHETANMPIETNGWIGRYNTALRHLALYTFGDGLQAVVKYTPGSTSTASLDRSYDHGYSWQQATTLPGPGLWSDMPWTFVDASTGYRVGKEANGRILRTTNGGITEELVHTGMDSLTFVANAPDGTIFAFGPDMLLRSTVGTAIWVNVTASGLGGASDMLFTGDGQGFSAGPHGIHHSDDGGLSWQARQQGNFIRITHRNGLHGAAVKRVTGGTGYRLVTTADGWQTMTERGDIGWQNYPQHAFRDRSVAFMYDADGMLYWSHGSILMSSVDQGASADPEMGLMVGRVSGLVRSGDFLVLIGTYNTYARKQKSH